MLMLSFAGCAFALIIGSFFGYHVYLVLYVFPFCSLMSSNNFFLDLFPSTNQTTLEHISPFYILRYLPPSPPSRLSSPPMEHQLASRQRRAVGAGKHGWGDCYGVVVGTSGVYFNARCSSFSH